MAAIPRPVVGVHGEDVDVEVPGLLRLTASFLSEGLFDEEAGGDPEEEDLYEIEVQHLGDALVEPITFPRLFPASPSDLLEDVEEADESEQAALPAERFLLALAWQLANADPSAWEELCEAARVWDSWTVEDVFTAIPPEWTPETLWPEDD